MTCYNDVLFTAQELVVRGVEKKVGIHPAGSGRLYQTAAPWTDLGFLFEVAYVNVLLEIEERRLQM